MLHLRIYSPRGRTQAVTDVLRAEQTVSALAVLEGACVRPPGDVVLADVPRESANGVRAEGAIQIEPVPTWISRPAYEAERVAPGAESDAVVWSDVVQRAYEDAELTFAFSTFMVLATLIAAIGIVLDSRILIIGAMALGPEFDAVAALGIALVRRRPALLRRGVTSLVAGFAIAIAVTTAAVALGRALGWIASADVSGRRPGTGYIYQPDRWSFIVAVIAGAAGVLAMTSAATAEYRSRMRISAKVDYALRAMLELATAEGLVKSERLATAQGIPQKFLQAILLDLRHAELVSSQRGVEGGHMLARPPGSISIADVIRAVEGPLATVRGMRPEELEYVGAAAALRETWIDLRTAMRGVLEETSLADVVARSRATG